MILAAEQIHQQLEVVELPSEKFPLLNWPITGEQFYAIVELALAQRISLQEAMDTLHQMEIADNTDEHPVLGWHS